MILFLLLFTQTLNAYPSMVRKGYNACASCHVSPNGGGTLTPYGRMSTEEILSTWSYEGEGNFAHGVELPEWLQIGGDTRYINVNSKKYHNKFLMQSDYEIAVTPKQGITAVIGAGYYGPKSDFEWRKNYLKVDLTENITVRAGHFMMSYGLNLPDHTVVTRGPLGFGQGKETYNVEASYHGIFGEFYLTGFVGPSQFYLTDKNGYQVTSDSESGFAVKAALFWTRKSQYGFSYYYGEKEPSGLRRMFGIYSAVGLTERIYVLTEHDIEIENKSTRYISLLDVGYELIRGIHLQSKLSQLVTKEKDSIYTVGPEISWYPRPHFDLSAKADWRFDAQGVTPAYIFIGHYYL